jgi:hypothetical protein
MAFNVGGFGSGFSEGMQNASVLSDQALSRQLKQQQLQEYLNAQAAQRAFTSMAIPGMGAMPGTPQQPGSGTPTLAQLPIIGPIAQGVEGVGNAFGELLGFGGGSGGPSGPSGGGGSPMPSMPMPSPGQRTDMGGDAGSSGAMTAVPGMPAMETMRMVAAAIDKANPGLKQSNPQAFAAAVQLGTQRVTEYTNAQVEAGKAQAEIGKLNAQTGTEKSKIPVNEARTRYYDARAANPPGGKSIVDQMNKEIHAQLTKNAVQLRHYEDQKARLLQAPVQTPEIKGLVTETQRYIDAHRIRQSDLEKQLPDVVNRGKEKPAQTTVKATEVAPAKKKALKASLDKIVSFNGDPTQTTRFVKFLQQKGVPQEEINYLLVTAKDAVFGAAEAPQVPQGR